MFFMYEKVLGLIADNTLSHQYEKVCGAVLETWPGTPTLIFNVDM